MSKRILWVAAVAVTVFALSFNAIAQPGGGAGQRGQGPGMGQGGGMGGYGDEPSGSKNAGNFLTSCRTS